MMQRLKFIGVGLLMAWFVIVGVMIWVSDDEAPPPAPRKPLLVGASVSAPDALDDLETELDQLSARWNAVSPLCFARFGQGRTF